MAASQDRRLLRIAVARGDAERECRRLAAVALQVELDGKAEAYRERQARREAEATP